MMKIQDYHYVLSKFFEKIYTLQQTDGIPCKVFGIDCNLKIPTFSFFGDTEGHDKLVGRFGSQHMVPSLCCYCYCPYDETDNERIKAKYIKQITIKNGGDVLKNLGITESTMLAII